MEYVLREKTCVRLKEEPETMMMMMMLVIDNDDDDCMQCLVAECCDIHRIIT